MELHSVKIAGSGTIFAGEYNVVSIAGTGKGYGQIICQTLKVAVTGKFEGRVEAKEVSVAGTAKFLSELNKFYVSFK